MIHKEFHNRIARHIPHKGKVCLICAVTLCVILSAFLVLADVWFGDTTKRRRLLIETKRDDTAFGGLWSKYRVMALYDGTNDIVFSALLLDEGNVSNIFETPPSMRIDYLDIYENPENKEVNARHISIKTYEIHKKNADKTRRCQLTAMYQDLTSTVYLAVIDKNDDADNDWINDAWEEENLTINEDFSPANDSGNARLEPLRDGTNNLARFILDLGGDFENAEDKIQSFRIEPTFYPVVLGNYGSRTFNAYALKNNQWNAENANWTVIFDGYDNYNSRSEDYTLNYSSLRYNIVLGNYGGNTWTHDGHDYSVQSSTGTLTAVAYNTPAFTNKITVYAALFKKNNSDYYSDNPDYDGMPNEWETLWTDSPFDTAINDAALDFDYDGLINIDEFLRGLNPVNEDTDGDGWNDEYEVVNEYDPCDDDMDDDGIVDGWDINPKGANPNPVIVVEFPEPGSII